MTSTLRRPNLWKNYSLIWKKWKKLEGLKISMMNSKFSETIFNSFLIFNEIISSAKFTASKV
jgi:hypothetical protein